MKFIVLLIGGCLLFKTGSCQQTMDLSVLLNSLTLQPLMFRDSLTHTMGFQWKGTGEVSHMPVATDTFNKGEIKLVKYYGWKTIVAAGGEGLMEMEVMKDSSLLRLFDILWKDEDEWNASYLYMENLTQDEVDRICSQALQLGAFENKKNQAVPNTAQSYQIFYFQNIYELELEYRVEKFKKYFTLVLLPVN